jgi:hypothetical protein
MNEILVVLAVLGVLLAVLYNGSFTGSGDLLGGGGGHQLDGGALLIEERKRREVPLYVYTGSAVSSRRWNTFYDRRHKDPKSTILDLIANSYHIHHQIGPVIPVTDEMLLAELNPDLRKEIAGIRGDVSLEHERILRDALLYKIVCKKGGILIPNNAILMKSTDDIWKQVLIAETGTVLYNGDGNSEYGPPIIVTRGGEVSERTADVLLEAAARGEFMGGISFGGGSTLLMKRISQLGHPVRVLGDVSHIRLDVLVEIGDLEPEKRDSAIIVIPFPQGAGRTSIVRKDEWVYVADTSEFLKNPLVITDILYRSGAINDIDLETK